MVNPYVSRKYGALFGVSILSVIGLATGFFYYGIFGAIGFYALGAMLGILVGVLVLRNPYTKMLEGHGMMVWNIDSTGIISPFNVNLRSPWIIGKLKKKTVTDVWDREAVMQLDNYRDAEAFRKDNYIYMRINTDAVNRDRFVHYTRPVMIYNEQLQSFLTKDYFSNKETSAFAKHHLLFLNRIVEDLNVNIRDFGRYVIETLKPKDKNAIARWVAYIVIGIIIIAVIFVAIKYGPGLLNSLTGSGQAAGTAIGQVKEGGLMPKVMP